MLRIIGAAMIIIAGSMIGILKSDALRKRAEKLEKIICGLNLLETDIGYGKTDLQKALFSIGENQKVDMLKKIAAELPKRGMKDALKTALKEDGEYLLEKDKAHLRSLGEILGMTDASTQVQAIKRTVSGLSEEKKNADREYERLGRLYRGSGILGGILGAIILI